MICDVSRMTSKDVIAFLKELGQSPDVYSGYSQGMEPLLGNHDVYIYAKGDEVLVTVLDPLPKHADELADEEPFNGDHPLWFTESSHRESPVWKLAMTCQMIRERLNILCSHKCRVRGLLLTSTNIINYDDITEIWDLLSVNVCHRMKGLRNIALPVNADAEEPDTLPISMVWGAYYNKEEIKNAERELSRFTCDSPSMDDTPPQPQLYDFDADDFDLDFRDSSDYDCNDDVDDDADDDCDINDVVHNKSTKRRSGIMREVADVTLTITPEVDGRLYSGGIATVTLTAEKGNYFLFDTYSCSIYTSDLLLMASGSKVACPKERLKGNLLTVSMPGHHVWLPGNYFLLLSNNDISFERIDFTLDEQLQPSLGERQACSLLGTEDVLLSYIDILRSYWNNLTSQPGTAQFRHYVIKRQQLAQYNRFYQSRLGHAIGTNVNLLISKRNDDIDEKFLHNLYVMCETKKQQFLYLNCSTLYDSSRPNPYETMNDELSNVSRRVICLDGIAMLLSACGKTIVKRVFELMRASNNENVLWLCGTRQEIDSLLGMYPSLNSFFLRDSRLEQEQYTTFELVQAFRNCLTEEFPPIGPSVMDALARAIIKGNSNGGMSAWTLKSIRRFVDEEVYPHYLEHAYSNFMLEDLAKLTETDLCLEKLTGSKSSFDECIRELDQMIGLDSVKQGIRTMANNARLYVERRRRGLKSSDKRVFHCIFTGNPGTGKTTVAKMLGRIYHSLGLLSKGEVIEVDRARLVGRYIGDTEENVKMVLEEARGNVLFIDEAYTLCTDANDHKDYGLRVIDSLMTVLSQPDPDMLIVFAGYPKEMDRLLATNPGLSSRFPYRYLFEDYNAEQLMQIARHLLERDEYILSDEAAAALRDVIGKALGSHSEHFGNARWITQLVSNGVVPALADRVFAVGSDDFQHVEASDIRVAYEKFSPQTPAQKSAPRKVVGFCA